MHARERPPGVTAGDAASPSVDGDGSGTTVARTGPPTGGRRGKAIGEQHYRALFRRSPEAQLVSDLSGRILEASDAAVSLFGFEDGALVGRSMRRLFAGPTRAMGVRADGSRFPAETTVSRLSVDGEARDLVIVRDLSERQRIQTELNRGQRMETIGLLVAGIAHELNNPIASILGLGELILRDPDLTPDVRDSADLLIEEADRVRSLVATFIEFIRPRPPERHPTAMRPLLESVQGLQSYSRASGIEWSVDVPPGLPRVAIDRSQIQQVILNLTTNAIQAIQADRPMGRIELAARTGPQLPAGRSVRISVTDDGPGVPEADRAQLFTPFYTTKAPGEGTGLGLSVSHDIVRNHHGRLLYEPAPGGSGARFTLDLPVTAPASLGAGELAGDPGAADGSSPGGVPDDRPAPVPKGGATPGPRRESPGQITTGGRQARVLVLDDVEAIRTFLARALRVAGCEAVAVADGATALSEIRQRPADVYLVDHRMVGMSGIQVYEAAQAADPRVQGRWIFMSGDVLNASLREFATLHGVALLAKPFDLATVLNMVRGVIERVGLLD